MKHLTLTLVAICIFAISSSGQSLETIHSFEHSLTASTPLDAHNSIHAGIEARASQRGGGSILFEENFANGFAGTNGNGAWTASDNANGELWIWVAPGNTGYYSNGNPTGVSHPAGEYSVNAGTLASQTPENGWMIFDCDYFNTPTSNGIQDTDGSLTSPIIDFSNDGSVILNWDQYFRYCCYPYAPIYVDVTNDGGASWTTFDGHGAFIEAANTGSANPLPNTLDISCVAAYSESVQFRFTYKQAPETGTAYSHYFWGIDDVVVSSNDNVDDLAMVQLTNGDVWNVWEYRVTPMEQAISAADGGVLAGVLYRNNGTANQEDVEVLVEVLNEAGDVVLASVTETIPTVYSFANGLNCPANSQDTLYIPTGWEPSTTGNYILRSTITSVSSTDASPEDNTMSKVIVYSDDEYGHDDESALDGEMFPRESDIPGLYDPSGQGCFYHTVNSGSIAYGITVEFGPNCGLSIGGNVAELEFESRLYFYDGAVGVTDSPYESAYWIFDPTWAGNSIYLPFDYPIELDADAAFFVGVIAEYESEGGLTVNAQLNSDTDNSTGEYNVTGGGDYVWFTSQTYTPSIRLILGDQGGCTDSVACNYEPFAIFDDGTCDYISCAGCTTPVACNYDPSASIDDGSCEFICNGCTDAGACNYDPSANVDDNSCIYPVQYYDCSGNCINDSDGDGLCDESEILGCLDPDSCNYNLEATDDDGSCEYITCSGCTYEFACNYDPDATIADNDSCEFGTCPGCTDSTACNYNPTVSEDDGSCIYPDQYYDCIGNCINDSDGDGVCDELEILGCTDPYSCNNNLLATDEDGSCEYITCSGCMDEFACNYDPEATIADNDSCVYDTCSGCTDSTACNYNPTVSDDDGSCIFAGDACDDGDAYTMNDTYSAVCECIGEVVISGCMSENACNYNANANASDDSCLFVGDVCDDEDATTDNDVIQDDCECAGTPSTIVDELEALSVLIYPNPATNHITVDLGDLTGLNTTMKMYDSSGKLVFEKQSSSLTTIDVTGFAKGIYTLDLSTSDNVLRSQVVVE